MNDKEDKVTISGPLVNQRRPRDGRPVWKKICSLPDMMIRPDERQDIKTFVNVSPHNSPLQRKKCMSPGATESFDVAREKEKAMDKAMIKSADRTTQNLRALLSPSYDVNSKALAVTTQKDTKRTCSPSLTEAQDSATCDSNNSEWPPTKQPIKSAMKRRTTTSPASDLVSTWHNIIEPSKELSMFERAATKKKESRWDESAKEAQKIMHRNQQQQCSPLKTPQRHVSIDSLSLASSMPPLTVYDTDDCTLATMGTVSVDLGSVDEQSELSQKPTFDNVKAALRKGSKSVEDSQNGAENDFNVLPQRQYSASRNDVLQSLVHVESTRKTKRIVERGGSDCSPTAVSDELEIALAASSSDENAITSAQNHNICERVSSALDRVKLECPDISTREDGQENSIALSLYETVIKDVGDPRMLDIGKRSRSTRSRSLSPDGRNKKEDRSRSRSLSLETRKNNRSRSASRSERKKKEQPARSKSKTRHSSRSRSTARASTRRSGSRETSKSKTKKKKDRNSRGTSEGSKSRVRSASKLRRGRRSTSPANRERSKGRSKSRSTSSRRQRSKSLSKSRSKTPRRHRSSSRAKERSERRSRSKSSTKRWQRKDLYGATAQVSRAKEQGRKVDDLLESSYSSIDANYTSLLVGNQSNRISLSVSLSALDYFGATKNPRTKNRIRKKHGEREMVPISSLLPPKKPSNGGFLGASCGSLQVNDLESVNTAADTVKRSGNSDMLIETSNKSDSDMPKSAPIRTGSTKELVKMWEEEMCRSSTTLPIGRTQKTMTTAKIQSRDTTGTTIEWVEAVLGP